MPIKMSKIETAIRISLAFNEAVNHHDIAEIMKLLSDDCIFEISAPAPDGTKVIGKEAIAHYLRDFFRHSPPVHIQIEDIYGFGHRCNMHWRCEWTDETGNKSYVRGVDIFKEKDGLICEKLSYVKGLNGY